MRRNLAFFDFDGTLTTRDTFIAFILFNKGLVRFVTGMLLLSPFLLLFLLRLIRNDAAKQKVMRYFFAGQSVDAFNRQCELFAKQVIPLHLREVAMKAVQKHLEKGDRVIVVSASAENWVRPWCINNGMECIATRLEVKDGLVTGNISGENCHGPEKVKRILEEIDLSTFGEISAYGDSNGDRELLQLAHHKYFRKF